MKIQSVPPAAIETGGTVQSTGPSFHQVVRGVFSSVDRDLKVVNTLEMKRGQLDAQELMKCQVHAHQLHFKVELCSKVGESLSASIKRFQSGQ